MTLQNRNYISEQKKRYLRNTLLWTIVVVAAFFSGLIIFKTRESYFTVFSGVMVIGVALNFSRYIGFSKFKDGKEEYADLLESIKGNYKLFHSVIIPDNRGTAFFEHLMITSKGLYFLGYQDQVIRTCRLWLENKLASKGIPLEQMHFITLENTAHLKDIILEIEKDNGYLDERLEEYSKVINDLLM